jgi:hypothetical protein
MSEEPSSPKKAFPLRISARLFEQLRAWADDELRSINGQIEYLLADAVRRRNRGSSKTSERSDPSDGSE